MPNITVSKIVYDRLVAFAPLPVSDSIVVHPNGERTFHISADTLENLEIRRFEGETIGDTILRIISTRPGVN